MTETAAVTDAPTTVWRQLPGGQSDFLRCPAFEILYEGERFCAKTEALLMKYAKHVGKGWRREWRGIIFRRTFPELAEIVERSRKLFPLMFPGARFVQSGFDGYTWHFPAGESLRFRYAKKYTDIEAYLGHGYPFIGWEELTTWADDRLYEAMMSCCRSSAKGIPLHVCSNTNPWGPGHAWVRARFIDPAPDRAMQNFEFVSPLDGSTIQLSRCRIHGRMRENLPGISNNPQYVAQLMAIKDPNLRKAWLEGSWDIQVGGRFTDAWNDELHFIPPFPIPSNWLVDRAFDWGSSAPFSVAWFAQSNGEELPEPVRLNVRGRPVDLKRFPRGTLFMIREWYGWNGKPNQGCGMSSPNIAKGILAREQAMKGSLLNGHRIHPGPADRSIFDVDVDSGDSIAQRMQDAGVLWEPSVKSKGSRVNGWEVLTTRLEAALPILEAKPMEEPGLFIFNTCEHFARCLRAAPRDERNPDDVDTTCEDHPLDMTRYRLLSEGPAIITHTYRQRG